MEAKSARKSVSLVKFRSKNGFVQSITVVRGHIFRTNFQKIVYGLLVLKLFNMVMRYISKNMKTFQTRIK